MRILANRIIEGLNRADHCAVYEADLSRFWPESDDNREAKIKTFAAENGFRLRFYKPGLCAIFDKDRNTETTQNGEDQSIDPVSREAVA